ncbi:Methyltransferase domain-containing protein [Gracilibacillus ureilyticus]|uniref:Methyltransferase domain-containing protein n=1 Tax=Gracilibacillus ureilyticus TaxID=531814 RepID=A0A1H9RTM7_9BACI|nr:class I SAM-dependent methyltransferase [Gracilibacillus ureilyticus]SER76162.1 Methyltransferase domain-containing protein [Gracilibacillus ureilyticus]
MKNEKKSVEEVHNYWIRKSSPEAYLIHRERSEFLLPYIRKYANTDNSILEIGCNAGRNLQTLFENDFKRLAGIEISKQAVEKLKKTYPALAAQSDVIHSPVEEWIKQVPSGHFDLVFTMAVLEHIHPDSEWVFEEIARISRKHILTIEDENTTNWRLFPRNYQKIFEQFGYQQVEEKDCKKADLEKYRLRIFERIGRASS